MNKKRQNIFYIILILLILLIVAVIGGLVMVLFNMSRPEQNSVPAVLPQAISNSAPPAPSSLTEKYIEAKPQELPPAVKKVEDVSGSGATVVPAVCDGYGPQIINRPAFKNKATYTASIQPNRITFTVYPDNPKPSKEAEPTP